MSGKREEEEHHPPILFSVSSFIYFFSIFKNIELREGVLFLSVIMIKTEDPATTIFSVSTSTVL